MDLKNSSNTIHINPSFIQKTAPIIHVNPSFVKPLLNELTTAPSTCSQILEPCFVLESNDVKLKKGIGFQSNKTCKSQDKRKSMNNMGHVISKSNKSSTSVSDKKFYSSTYLKSQKVKFSQPMSKYSFRKNTTASNEPSISLNAACNTLPNVSCRTVNLGFDKPKLQTGRRLYSLDNRRKSLPTSEEYIKKNNDKVLSRTAGHTTEILRKPLRPTNHSKTGSVSTPHKIQIVSPGKFSLLSGSTTSMQALQEAEKDSCSNGAYNSFRDPHQPSRDAVKVLVRQNKNNSRFSKINRLDTNFKSSLVSNSCFKYNARNSITRPGTSSIKLIRNKTLNKSRFKLVRNTNDVGRRNVFLVKTKTKLIKKNSAKSSVKNMKHNFSPNSTMLRRSPIIYKKVVPFKATEHIGTVASKRSQITPNLRFRMRPMKQKNKFKLVNASKVHKDATRSTQVSKYKFNRIPEPKKSNFALQSKNGFHTKVRTHKKSDKFINIEGNLYKSTRMSLKKQDLSLKSSGAEKIRERKSLGAGRCRKDTYRRQNIVNLQSGTLIEIVRRKKLTHFKRINDYCFFYNKYGKCRRENKGCPFIHDPKKIAICTRFLKGVSCDEKKCPFSHTLDRNKMPVCSHFMEGGSCHRDPCPYRHVRVNPQAPVCKNFLKGHCPQGEECKKKHILICDEFKTTGVCTRGKFCLLSHRKVAESRDASKKSRRKSLSSKKRIKSRRRSSGKIGILGLCSGKEPPSYLKPAPSSARYFDAEDDVLISSCDTNLEVASTEPEFGSTKPKDGSKKSEVGSRKPEVGSRKPEVRSIKQELGFTKPDFGSSKTYLHSFKKDLDPIKPENLSEKQEIRLPKAEAVHYSDSDETLNEIKASHSLPLEDTILESDFLAKRQRILKKVETLKQLYSVGLDIEKASISKEHMAPSREHRTPSKEHLTSSSGRMTPSKEHPTPSKEHPTPPHMTILETDNLTSQEWGSFESETTNSETSYSLKLGKTADGQNKLPETFEVPGQSGLDFELNRLPLPEIMPDYIPLVWPKDKL